MLFGSVNKILSSIFGGNTSKTTQTPAVQAAKPEATQAPARTTPAATENSSGVVFALSPAALQTVAAVSASSDGKASGFAVQDAATAPLSPPPFQPAGLTIAAEAASLAAAQAQAAAAPEATATAPTAPAAPAPAATAPAPAEVPAAAAAAVAPAASAPATAQAAGNEASAATASASKTPAQPADQDEEARARALAIQAQESYQAQSLAERLASSKADALAALQVQANDAADDGKAARAAA